MKRTHKRVVGFLGLVGVAAITTIAIMMPAPATQAVSTMTDTVTVRVVGEATRVVITDPTDGSVFVSPGQIIKYEYEAANRVTLTLDYTDADDVVHHYTLEDFDAGHNPGEGQTILDLSGSNYGYGNYRVTLTGEGNGGVTSTDVIEFSYLPATATTVTDDETGESKIIVNYDPENDDIGTIVVEIYDENGNPVDGLSPITITPPDTEYNFNASDYGLDGKYTIKVNVYDPEGELVYKPYQIEADYNPELEPTKVPNTGGLFGNTNISQTDYLVTGLLIFGIVAVLGMGFAMKNGKKTNTGKTNRRR